MFYKILLDEEEQVQFEREHEYYGSNFIHLDLKLPLENVLMDKVVKLDKNVTVKNVLEVFKDENINVVLITDGDKEDYGIFTENDYIHRILSEDIDIENSRVGEFATLNPESLDIKHPIFCALNIFAHARFKHILVKINERFEYILTPSDILRFLSSNANKSILNLPPDPLKNTKEINGG